MATLQTLHLKFLPSDSSHFFIGTNMVSCSCSEMIISNEELLLCHGFDLIPVQGLVNHGTSHGLKAPPKFYRCREAGARPVEVTSVQFSPFKPQFFLVSIFFFFFAL